MFKRSIIAIVVLMACRLAYAKDETPTHSVNPKADVKAKLELRQIEENIVMYTNQQRARYGLAPLTIDEKLVESARNHAIWMTRNRSLQHTSRPVAENIAVGYPSSQSVVQGWMNSSGHRANILNGGYRRIGVAAYRTESGTIYWCQQFLR